MDSKTLHFVDPVSHLPHYVALLPDLEQWLRDDLAIGMLYLNINGLDRVEEAHGPKVFDKILRDITKLLKRMQGSIVRKNDLLAISDIGGTGFMIFLSEKRDKRETGKLQKHDVEMVADRVQEYLFPQVFALLYHYTKEKPRLLIGYSFVVHNPLIRIRRLLHRLIDEAREMAYLQSPRTEIRNKERLQRLILSEEVTTLFQPIVNLNTGTIMGYEALSRGPAGTVFESPTLLFTLARDAGLVFELDRLCRKMALRSAAPLPSDCKLFINTIPHTIHDPEFRGKYLEDLLRDVDKKPSNIVFELTERAAIENFSSFREAMRYYTDIGMAIAIDDAGTGYSTLEAIVELNPRYLKFDLSMVRGINRSPIKQEMLRLLCALAKKIDAIIIAEGIESREELAFLMKTGVAFGQGFYFSKSMTAADLVKDGSQSQVRRNRSLLSDKIRMDA
ncbi:MAG TPA: EAL domain-containing protein [Bdellovibrionota bacterium]|nr:EAL domain-containing protein [Bdellovibrionota bacterium]